MIDFEVLRSIEDKIDSETKKSHGIYFTPLTVVDEITQYFDFSKINRVIDSTAGCGNFLLPLALKHPDIEFYGIEKNKTLYQWLSSHSKNVPNLKVFHGDLLTDKFPIPACDLYLGNPPFVNYVDLIEEDKKHFRKLWLEYFPDAKGFKMLLGTSRGDLALLCYIHTIKKYLKNEAQIGVVLPKSLVVGNGASSGFRSYKDIGLQLIKSLPRGKNFVHTNRENVFVIGQKNRQTIWPLRFEEKGVSKDLVTTNNHTFIEQRFYNLLGSNPYEPRQGINTLGANSVFFFDIKPFESKLIKPLLRSGDLSAYKANGTKYVLLPYNIDGKIIKEEDLKKLYPIEYKYLLSKKNILKKRKSRFASHNWYCLFGIGPYTFKKYKVVWRSLGARQLKAAIVEEDLPNQAMYCYIGTDNYKEGLYLTGVMNSKILGELVSSLSPPGSKGYAQPGVINQIALKPYDENNSTMKEIAEVVESLLDKRADNLQHSIDKLVENLYSQ
ncbi:N-6 DNA methylase [Spirochaeta cellobiosiphila]|uniref:N-6 DNA methylase n=1 Tax=Spirochaeta cellobiosiphila TaxID=504483 RepID=UPI001469FA0D|nr:N-6 DNA methylase [Spirochaeta cellobiosiphila]